jgi:mRNA interferase RelE/StbE
MKKFGIKYHPRIKKEDLKKIDKATKQRIRTAIENKLIKAPELFGNPLKGNLQGIYKFKVGSYRVLFFVDDQTQTIYVLAIIHRKEAYSRTSIQEILKRLTDSKGF